MAKRHGNNGAYHFFREEYYLPEKHGAGLDEWLNRSKSCEQASRQLRERMEKSFFKFAWRHGIKPDEARHLLLNTGLAEQREAA